MPSEILDWIKIVGPIIFSWPMVAIIFVVIFRKQIIDLLENTKRAVLGPVTVERELNKIAEQGQQIADQGQQALININNITELMAKSRLFELEVFNKTFGLHLSQDERNELIAQIEDFKRLYNIREKK